MTIPQSGVLPEGNRHALFITLRTGSEPDHPARVRTGCAALPGLTDEIARLDPQARLSSVVAVGAEAWGHLFPGRGSGRLRPFRAREEGPRHAPATPADLLLHVRSERPDLNYLVAHRLMGLLGEAVTLVEEVAGFRFLDSRDLTGFVDGTENPQGEERAEVALVGEEEPGLAGGSYIHMQRYVHRLSDWEGLPVDEQEAVIGRTKADDIELDDGVRPPTAHISRVVIEDQGEELEILRHSMPYGGVREAGLVFVAYARTPDPFDRMLDRMIYADQSGSYDHLMDYTRAVTGCAFFAPSRGFLEGL